MSAREQFEKMMARWKAGEISDIEAMTMATALGAVEGLRARMNEPSPLFKMLASPSGSEDPK
jgi:hypothetical protein